MYDIKLIEKTRVIKGLRKKDLCETAGIAQNSYQRILSGEVKRPHAPTVKAICDALGLDVADVYTGDQVA